MSREQGAMSREQGAMSREQGAMSREQRAMSREQGGRSRERGAMSIQYSRLLRDLRFATTSNQQRATSKPYPVTSTTRAKFRMTYGRKRT